LILRDENTDQDGLCDDERIYYLADANYNVTALIDTSGNVLERYLYSPYGEVTVLDADFSSDADGVSDYANTTLYTGRELDAATGLLYYRARYYCPRLGRFVGKDPLRGSRGSVAFRRPERVFDSMEEVNLYLYVGNRPIGHRDPSGLYTRRTYTCFGLGAGGTTSVTVDFQCCGPAQRTTIGNDMCAAKAALMDALADVGIVRALIDEQGQPLQARDPANQAIMNRVYPVLNQYFATPVLQNPNNLDPERMILATVNGQLSRQDVQQISTIIAQTVVAFDYVIGIQCETSCDAGVFAEIRPVWWLGAVSGSTADVTDIHICPLYFGLTPNERSRKLIHEITHEYPETADYGDITTVLPAPGGPAPTYNVNSGDGPGMGFLYSEYLIWNASTYEGFMSLYLP